MTSSGLTDVPVMGFTPTAGAGLLVVTQAGWLLTEGSRSTRSVVTRSAMSPFDGLPAGLGGARMRCGGVTGLSGGEGASFGLAKGDGFGHPFVLGLASDVVGRNPLALMIEAAVGVRSTKGTGLGSIDSSTSVAQSNRLGSHAISSTVPAGAGGLSSRLFSSIPSSLLSSLSLLLSFSSLLCCLSSAPPSVFPILSSGFSLSCCSTVVALTTIVVPVGMSVFRSVTVVRVVVVIVTVTVVASGSCAILSIAPLAGVGVEAGVAVSNSKVTIGSVVI
jgi:hypothetical protein